MAGFVAALLVRGVYFGVVTTSGANSHTETQVDCWLKLSEAVESGREIPRDLESLCSIVGYTIDLPGFRYNPDAWGKPGAILFQSRVPELYVLTFGDGSRSAVEYWVPSHEVDLQSGEDYSDSLEYLYTRPDKAWQIICIGSTLALVVLAVAAQLTRRRLSGRTM